MPLKAGTNIVGGVNARKAGTTVSHTGPRRLGVGATRLRLGRRGDVGHGRRRLGGPSWPPAFAKDAAIEAIEASIPLLVIITEGIPVQDSADLWATAQAHGNATRIIGPNCPRHHHGRRESLAGIQRPATITGKGPIGPRLEVGHADLPDDVRAARSRLLDRHRHRRRPPSSGTTHIDALAAFEADPETKAIVMIGEIGGDAEERAADFIKANVTKPVVGYGRGNSRPPEGKTMGHAGAIVSGSAGTAQAKKEALEAAGVKVGKTPSETASLMPRGHREPVERQCGALLALVPAHGVSLWCAAVAVRAVSP